MPKLTIIQNHITHTFSFEGTPILSEVLTAAGFLIPHPCGGKGKCGKCAVTATGALSDPTEAEIKSRTRLSCMTRLLGNAFVTLPDTNDTMHIETDSAALTSATGEGYGAAVSTSLRMGVPSKEKVWVI